MIRLCGVLFVSAVLATAAARSVPVSTAALDPATSGAARLSGWGPLPHEPPVGGTIADPFRPPDVPYGPGNRGIEWNTVVGGRARASQTGTVSFAGTVAGQRWVTIRHSTRLRTSVGPLATIAIAAGDQVDQGDLIGTTGPLTHFSARLEGDYIDPNLLFGEMQVVVRLVDG